MSLRGHARIGCTRRLLAIAIACAIVAVGMQSTEAQSSSSSSSSTGHALSSSTSEISSSTGGAFSSSSTAEFSSISSTSDASTSSSTSDVFLSSTGGGIDSTSSSTAVELSSSASSNTAADVFESSSTGVSLSLLSSSSTAVDDTASTLSSSSSSSSSTASSSSPSPSSIIPTSPSPGVVLLLKVRKVTMRVRLSLNELSSGVTEVIQALKMDLQVVLEIPQERIADVSVTGDTTISDNASSRSSAHSLVRPRTLAIVYSSNETSTVSFLLLPSIHSEDDTPDDLARRMDDLVRNSTSSWFQQPLLRLLVSGSLFHTAAEAQACPEEDGEVRMDCFSSSIGASSSSTGVEESTLAPREWPLIWDWTSWWQLTLIIVVPGLVIILVVLLVVGCKRWCCDAHTTSSSSSAMDKNGSVSLEGEPSSHGGRVKYVNEPTGKVHPSTPFKMRPTGGGAILLENALEQARFQQQLQQQQQQQQHRQPPQQQPRFQAVQMASLYSEEAEEEYEIDRDGVVHATTPRIQQQRQQPQQHQQHLPMYHQQPSHNAYSDDTAGFYALPPSHQSTPQRVAPPPSFASRRVAPAPQQMMNGNVPPLALGRIPGFGGTPTQGSRRIQLPPVRATGRSQQQQQQQLTLQTPLAITFMPPGSSEAVPLQGVFTFNQPPGSVPVFAATQVTPEDGYDQQPPPSRRPLPRAWHTAKSDEELEG